MDKISEESQKFPHFSDIEYNRLPKCPGLYWLTFANGKCYIGHTKNLYNRITTHFKELMKEKDWASNWYQICRIENKRLCKSSWAKWSFYTFLVYTTKIKIIICPTKEAAHKLEQRALTILKEDGKDEHYYNSEYYNKGGKRVVERKPKFEPIFGEVPQSFAK